MSATATPRRRSWTVVELIVAAGFLGLAAFGCNMLWQFFHLWDTPYTGRDKIAFSRDAWIAAGDESGDRYLMLDDLLARVPLEGRSREEVEALLGKLNPPVGPDCGWYYYLGPEPSFVSIDSILLDLRFDNSDCVVAVSTRVN